MKRDNDTTCVQGVYLLLTQSTMPPTSPPKRFVAKICPNSCIKTVSINTGPYNTTTNNMYSGKSPASRIDEKNSSSSRKKKLRCSLIGTPPIQEPRLMVVGRKLFLGGADEGGGAGDSSIVVIVIVLSFLVGRYLCCSRENPRKEGEEASISEERKTGEVVL